MRYFTKHGQRCYQYALDQKDSKARELRELLKLREEVYDTYTPRHIATRIKELQNHFNEQLFTYWVFTNIDNQISMKDYLIKYVLPYTKYKMQPSSIEPDVWVAKTISVHKGTHDEMLNLILSSCYRLWKKEKTSYPYVSYNALANIDQNH